MLGRDIAGAREQIIALLAEMRDDADRLVGRARAGLDLLSRVKAVDPHVPIPDVTAFAEEMNAAGADWQLTMYGGAQHGFTHADAKPGAIPGVAYHEQADALSFAAARDFLARAFGQTRAGVTGSGGRARTG